MQFFVINDVEVILTMQIFILQNLSNHSTQVYILEFLRMMSVCHTVIPEKIKNSEDMVYHASSPGK